MPRKKSLERETYQYNKSTFTVKKLNANFDLTNKLDIGAHCFSDMEGKTN